MLTLADADKSKQQNVLWITTMAQFTLALFLVPTVVRIVIRKFHPHEMASLKDASKVAARLAVLLFVSEYTFNVGLIKGNVTTTDFINSSVPIWTYLMSLCSAAEEQTFRLYKLLFCVLCAVGIVLMTLQDSLSD